MASDQPTTPRPTLQLSDLKLRRLRDERRQLRETVELHEQYRKLIAYELHDGLAQQLAGAVMLLESTNSKDPVVHRSTEQVRAALVECRRLINDLRPLTLDDLGLADAIECLIAEVRERYASPPTVYYRRDTDIPRMVWSLELVIYRLVQEALTNAVKHSQGDTITVFVRTHEGHLFVTVADNGKGFDGEHVYGHHGLNGLKERTELFGGKTIISSVPGEGTTLKFILPIKERPHPSPQMIPEGEN